MTTTFTEKGNRDIVTGAWRPLNLQRFPFYFTKPIEIFSEKCSEGDFSYSDKSLALYEIRVLNISFFSFFLVLINLYRRIGPVFKKRIPQG